MQLLNKKTVDKKQVKGLIFESYFDSKMSLKSSQNKELVEYKGSNKKDKLFSKIKDLLEEL